MSITWNLIVLSASYSAEIRKQLIIHERRWWKSQGVLRSLQIASVHRTRETIWKRSKIVLRTWRTTSVCSAGGTVWEDAEACSAYSINLSREDERENNNGFHGIENEERIAAKLSCLGFQMPNPKPWRHIPVKYGLKVGRLRAPTGVTKLRATKRA